MDLLKRFSSILLVLFLFVLTACSSPKSDGSEKKSTASSGGSHSGQARAHPKTERICYGYISKDKLDSILKSPMYANDYSSGLGECDYKKVATTEAHVLQGTQVRITKKVGSDWFNKQKDTLGSGKDFQLVSGVGDKAFVTGLLGWGSLYVLKDGSTWFISLYTGDMHLIPALTDLNAHYNAANRQKVAKQKMAVLKQLAIAAGES